jgi:hypothetical protein
MGGDQTSPKNDALQQKLTLGADLKVCERINRERMTVIDFEKLLMTVQSCERYRGSFGTRKRVQRVSSKVKGIGSSSIS